MEVLIVPTTYTHTDRGTSTASPVLLSVTLCISKMGMPQTQPPHLLVQHGLCHLARQGNPQEPHTNTPQTLLPAKLIGNHNFF